MKLNPIRLIRLASQVLIMVAATLAVFGLSFTLSALYYLPSWIPLSFLFFGIALILIWVSSVGFVNDLQLLIKELEGKPTGTKPDQRMNPVEIAKIQLRIDDPEGKAEFDQFLKSPVYKDRSNPGYKLTPNELAEEYIIKYVREFEKKYHEQISVGTEVRSGSFIVDLEFWGNAYNVLSTYNDAILGVFLLRQQIQWVLTQISDTYRKRTKRSARIDSDVSVKSKTKVSASIDEATKSNSSAGTVNSVSPVTVNTFSPPATSNKDMNINVHLSNTKNAGCVSLLLLFISLLLLLILVGPIFIYCGYLDSELVCQDISRDLSNRISSLLIRWAIYLDSILMPQQP
jgi:hypothetical protein